MLESLAARRGLWAATLEAYSQPDHDPRTRTALVDALAAARRGLAQTIGGTEAGSDEEWISGSVYQALLTGLALQFLLDPERSLSGRDLARGCELLAERLAERPAADAG